VGGLRVNERLRK
jgi:Domain of unknown function (DUF4145)